MTELRARGVARILITEAELQQEIRAIAAELDAEYGADQPLMVGVLTGAVAFMADLMKAMTIPVQLDFMAISSYGAATKSSGVVRILKDLNEDIEGRRLIVVEDIVDSGLTLQYLLEMLKARQSGGHPGGGVAEEGQAGRDRGPGGPGGVPHPG